MVCRTHKYADGGKIVRGSSSPGSPGITGAIKDAVGAIKGRSKTPAPPMKPMPKALGSGGAGKAAEKISGRESYLEKKIREQGG